MNDDDPQWLYRIHGTAKRGRPLYVGVTNSLPRRMSEHSRDKEWFPDSGRITFEMHAGRASVLAAEEAAIRKERPLHNVQHNTVRVDLSVSAEVKLNFSNVAALTAAALGLILLAKWGADAYSVRRTRTLCERQGIEYQAPKVACPFTEKPLSTTAELFYMMMAVAALPPVVAGDPGSSAALDRWRMAMTPAGALTAGTTAG